MRLGEGYLIKYWSIKWIGSLIYQKRTTYTPSWVKVKYGAWYLNPTTWKKQKDGEPLEDPKQQQENTFSEAKAESEKLVRVCLIHFW